MARFEVTRDNQRLLELLKSLKKVPAHLNDLSGISGSETIDEDNVAGYSLILGNPAGVDGRKPKSIPIATGRNERPLDKGGRIYRADVVPDGEGFKLVRQFKDDVALRFINTGFLVAPDGTTNRDFRELVGHKLRYHGAFPLTADAATVVGEDVDLTITAQSRKILEESFGTIQGLPGVPRCRELAIEGVIGGPVLVGQINGLLKIHELTSDGWKFHDVTSSAVWQKKFMDLAMKDATYLGAIAEAEQKQQRRRKKIKITKAPPPDHPDA